MGTQNTSWEMAWVRWLAVRNEGSGSPIIWPMLI